MVRSEQFSEQLEKVAGWYCTWAKSKAQPEKTMRAAKLNTIHFILSPFWINVAVHIGSETFVWYGKVVWAMKPRLDDRRFPRMVEDVHTAWRTPADISPKSVSTFSCLHSVRFYFARDVSQGNLHLKYLNLKKMAITFFANVQRIPCRNPCAGGSRLQ